MLGLKLKHVSKRGQRSQLYSVFEMQIITSTGCNRNTHRAGYDIPFQKFSRNIWKCLRGGSYPRIKQSELLNNGASSALLRTSGKCPSLTDSLMRGCNGHSEFTRSFFDEFWWNIVITRSLIVINVIHKWFHLITCYFAEIKQVISQSSILLD